MAIPTPQDAAREEVFGAALKAMSTHLDVHWWAIVGHGEGGTVASTIASVVHVSYTLLIIAKARPKHAQFAPILQLLLVNYWLLTYNLLLAAVRMRHNTMLLHMQPRVRMLGMLGALPAADIGASLVNKNIYCLVVSGTQDTVVAPQAVADSLTAYSALAVTRTLNVTHSDFVNGWSSSNGGSGAVVSLIPEIATGIGFMQYYAVMPEGEQYMDSTDE
eukprot:12450-Heterococcus_DN1.PRE.2